MFKNHDLYRLIIICRTHNDNVSLMTMINVFDD